ncbi:hypothetical protein AVEN_116784-1 [Araneus ventricosus]|uniref:Uncharacterized protein n=1 Tax=Araneus ventricosus TaxID=182803 RepID=A0A4Y2D8X3_ARAVE|nr:hypothetical protein AVEN_116784-1 [Araneus ventricosus]
MNANPLPYTIAISQRSEVQVALWYGVGLGAGRFQVRNSVPLNIRRVLGLLNAKYGAKRLPPGAALRGSLERDCQLKWRPSHLTEVQNVEVHPKITLVLFRNGTLVQLSKNLPSEYLQSSEVTI